MVDELFPEDIQDLIRAKFERIKGMSQSELIMDSNASDHHIHLMMMMANEDSITAGGGPKIATSYQSVSDHLWKLLKLKLLI